MDARLKLYLQKWRWYERNGLPWNRARIHAHMLRSEAFIRFPIQGNVLEALDDGRLEIGKGTLLEPGCWITIADDGHVAIGEGTFLNLGTMVAAQHEVTIGSNVMFANHRFVSDASHRYDDPTKPVAWQGFDSKGPTRIGDNCRFGGIGDTCWSGFTWSVRGGWLRGGHGGPDATWVFPRPAPARPIAAGAPAKVI